MKNRLFLIRLLLLYLVIVRFSTEADAQVNVDSIYNYWKSNTKIAPIKVNSSFQLEFFDSVNRINFRFSCDKTGQLTDDIWGICLVRTYIDAAGRAIEKAFFARNGQFAQSDSPPMIKIHYDEQQNVVQNDYFNSNLQFVERIEVYTDSLGREVALIGYDHSLKMTTKQTTEYLDAELATIKKYYDSTNQLTVNKCGVAIWYVRKNKPDGFEVERRYLDPNGKLVECAHDDPELRFAYFIAVPTHNLNEWKMSYYSLKGKVVRSFVFKVEG